MIASESRTVTVALPGWQPGLLKPGQSLRDPPGPDSDSAALTRRAGPGVQLPGVAGAGRQQYLSPAGP